MKNRSFLIPAVLLAGIGGVLTTGTAFAAAEPVPAQPRATLECHETTGALTVRHRAPVHTRPSADAVRLALGPRSLSSAAEIQ
jgi:hypothetical protein